MNRGVWGRGGVRDFKDEGGGGLAYRESAAGGGETKTSSSVPD